MRNLFVLCIAFLWMAIATSAQVGISSDNSAPVNSAMLDVNSTTRGMLMPRMTAGQIQLIPAPDNGLQVYCTDNGKLYIFVASSNQWKEVAYGTGTLTPSTCGQSITKNHVAGTVAPVTKTVTYGIVLGIPGETAKCWITSNLGADHQAAAVSDATEASAGWYWQFNRKQGYKHDGTTRTPSTTWISSFNVNSEWITANDPCNIELGTSWRIPTYSEWYNVDNSGGWDTWTGPWGSGLKLHAAGYLGESTGSLLARGLAGLYWSSTQFDNEYAWYLYFGNMNSDMINYSKAVGNPVRCVRSN